MTYRVRPVLGTVKMNHTIDTGKRGAATLVAVVVQLLLRQNITTSLESSRIRKRLQLAISLAGTKGVNCIATFRVALTSHENETILIMKVFGSNILRSSGPKQCGRKMKTIAMGDKGAAGVELTIVERGEIST